MSAVHADEVLLVAVKPQSSANGPTVWTPAFEPWDVVPTDAERLLEALANATGRAPRKVGFRKLHCLAAPGTPTNDAHIIERRFSCAAGVQKDGMQLIVDAGSLPGQRNKCRFPLPSQHTPEGKAERKDYVIKVKANTTAALADEVLQVAVQPRSGGQGPTIWSPVFQPWEVLPVDAERLLKAVSRAIGRSEWKVGDRKLQQARQLVKGTYQQNNRQFQWLGITFKLPNATWDDLSEQGPTETNLYRLNLKTGHLYVRTSSTHPEIKIPESDTRTKIFKEAKKTLQELH
ncbi:unnamed protein product [Sympodiomycopsis kandeliae]